MRLLYSSQVFRNGIPCVAAPSASGLGEFGALDESPLYVGVPGGRPLGMDLQLPFWWDPQNLLLLGGGALLLMVMLMRR